MSKPKLFVISVALTASVLLGMIHTQRPRQTAADVPVLHRVADGVFVTSQLQPKDIPALKRQGIQTIVDDRPDGEADDQALSVEIELVAKGNGIGFHFIPIPHEIIPGGAVDELSQVLSRQAKPVLLYCRTGRRAVRTFALVEASRVDGPSVDAILGMVRGAGFSADDLKENIAQRVSRRSNTQVAKNDVR